MIKQYFFLPSTSWTIPYKPDNAQPYTWPTVVIFMARFLLFVAFLNASAAVVLDRRRISFYTCSFFKFACFAAVLKWKSLNFTAEKISNLWHQVQKKLRVKSRRSHSNSHLESRENQTDNTSRSSEPELLLSPEGGQYQQSGALHYISGHWKLFVGEYFTNKHEEFCGPLGVIVFTANINDFLRPVPVGILPVLCKPWPTFTLWDQGQMEKQKIPSLAWNSINQKCHLEYLHFIVVFFFLEYLKRYWLEKLSVCISKIHDSKISVIRPSCRELWFENTEFSELSSTRKRQNWRLCK